ncbi:SET domain protein, partial [Necator americanus]
FGVRAAEPIPEQTFICEYAGEVLDKEEVEERAMFKHDHNYTLTVQEHGAGGVITTFIDPRRRGNLARFINHGCQPNLSMAIVRIGYTVPHIALFSNRQVFVHKLIKATEVRTLDVHVVSSEFGSSFQSVVGISQFSRKIHVGEELCYDYGVSALGGTERKRCLCGSTGCRGYLPMSSTASE